MIIAISGLTGSGKNTVGELVAEETGYRLICPTFKDLAAKEGISLMEFQKKAEKDPGIDKKFDTVLKEQTARGNCVVTTWLGPWMTKADVRIKLFVPDDIRAQRVAKRDGISVKKALTHIKERDEQNRARYKKVYGIDIFDENIFDVCLNGSKFTPKQLAELVIEIMESRELE